MVEQEVEALETTIKLQATKMAEMEERMDKLEFQNEFYSDQLKECIDKIEKLTNTQPEPVSIKMNCPKC